MALSYEVLLTTANAKTLRALSITAYVSYFRGIFNQLVDAEGVGTQKRLLEQIQSQMKVQNDFNLNLMQLIEASASKNDPTIILTVTHSIHAWLKKMIDHPMFNDPAQPYRKAAIEAGIETQWVHQLDTLKAALMCAVKLEDKTLKEKLFLDKQAQMIMLSSLFKGKTPDGVQ